MINTPIYGLTYPAATDHTRTWEYWQSLATQLEAKLSAGFACCRLDVAQQNLTANVSKDLTGALGLNVGGFVLAGADITVPQAGTYAVGFDAMAFPVNNNVNFAAAVNGTQICGGIAVGNGTVYATTAGATIVSIPAGGKIKAIGFCPVAATVAAAKDTLLWAQLLSIRP